MRTTTRSDHWRHHHDTAGGEIHGLYGADPGMADTGNGGQTGGGGTPPP